MVKCNHKIGVSDVMDHISFEFYTELNRDSFNKQECSKYLFKYCPDCGQENKKQEDVYYNMLNEGGAMMRYTNSGVDLFSIPIGGGEPMFVEHCDDMDHAKSIADTWT